MRCSYWLILLSLSLLFACKESVEPVVEESGTVIPQTWDSLQAIVLLETEESDLVWRLISNTRSSEDIDRYFGWNESVPCSLQFPDSLLHLAAITPVNTSNQFTHRIDGSVFLNGRNTKFQALGTVQETENLESGFCSIEANDWLLSSDSAIYSFISREHFDSTKIGDINLHIKWQVKRSMP